MKKFLFLLVILICGSCCKSTYEITYVDLKSPTDTLTISTTITERKAFRGGDAIIHVVSHNVGDTFEPIYINYLETTSTMAFGHNIVYSSPADINIVEIRYKSHIDTTHE